MFLKGKKRTLKTGAVPSRNLPNPSFTEYPRNPGSKFNESEIAIQTQARELRSIKRNSGEGNSCDIKILRKICLV